MSPARLSFAFAILGRVGARSGLTVNGVLIVRVRIGAAGVLTWRACRAPQAPTGAHTRGTRAGWLRAARRVMRWSWIEGARGKVHPSRAGGDTARGRPVGGPGGRAALRRSADAARSRPAVDGVARSRGSAPHSRPAPASRTHRGRTPSRTPPRGTAPCATAWLWLSRLAAAAATPAPGAEAMWRDGGDRPTGVGGRRRAARWAAITRARRQPPSRSPEIETLGTGSCRCENLGACDRSRASAGHACRPTRRSPARTRPRPRRCLGAAAIASRAGRAAEDGGAVDRPSARRRVWSLRREALRRLHPPITFPEQRLP